MESRKENIVVRAWEFIEEFPSLKKFNFLPSLFGISWLLLLLAYQIIFTLVQIFHKKDQALSLLFHLIHTTYVIQVIFVVVTIFLLYTITSPIAKGGIIHMMDTYRKNKGQKFHRSWQGLFDGLSHFLPIFEAQNIIAIFSPLTILTFYILLIRLFGIEFFTLITGVMGTYLIFAFIMNMCFAYSPFFIVLEGKKGIESLSASTGMAVRNIDITARFYFTNLLLYLRTILIGLIFLLFPLIISGIIAFFSAPIIQFALTILFSIIAVILFVIIVHLNSTLEIFVLALWYEAYQECKKEESTYEGEKDEHAPGEHAHHH